jgi:hypothetical protein
MDGAVGFSRIGGIVLVFLTADAVPACLPAGDHIPRSFDAPIELLHQLQMPWSGCADESILGNVPALPEFPITRTDLITVQLGTHPPCFGCALNFLTMLIHPCDEQHALVLVSLETSQRVAGNRGVRAAEVGSIVDVIERSCEGVIHLEGRNSATSLRRRILTTTFHPDR